MISKISLGKFRKYMHIIKSGLVIPLEIWMIIFKYTDNESFNKLLQCIKDLDQVTYKKVMLLICWDAVKKNKRIVAMIRLIRNFDFYRLMNNYLNFKNEWINIKVGLDEFVSLNSSDKFSYKFKRYIIDNNVITNDRDRKMFNHLTSEYSDKYLEEPSEEELQFYGNTINIETVVKNNLIYNIY